MRRKFCLAAVLLAIVVGAWFCVPRGRISLENCKRIEKGMTFDEVTAILGSAEPLPKPAQGVGFVRIWSDGRNAVIVIFKEGKVDQKGIDQPSVWKVLRWCAKRAAATIGLK